MRIKSYNLTSVWNVQAAVVNRCGVWVRNVAMRWKMEVIDHVKCDSSVWLLCRKVHRLQSHTVLQKSGDLMFLLIIFSPAVWAYHVTGLSVCVYLDVNPGGTNHNRYTQTCNVARTDLLMNSDQQRKIRSVWPTSLVKISKKMPPKSGRE